MLVEGDSRWARKRSSIWDRLLTTSCCQKVSSSILSSWIAETIKYYCRVAVSILLNG